MKRVSGVTRTLVKRLSSVVAPSEDEVQRKRMRSYRKSRKRTSRILGKKKPAKNRLTQRTNTVTPMHFPMYVISYDDVVELFGERDGSRRARIFSFERLKKMGRLRLKETLPEDATTIYVSHEWPSWNHADPRGTQIRTLCEALKRYREMKSILPAMSAESRETNSVFKRQIFIWFDWFCMPQHDKEEEEEEEEEEKKDADIIDIERKAAMSSIPAYIERSSLMVILAPVCIHAERIDPRSRRYASINYRTWRRCGLCLSEMMYTVLSRYKAHPITLIRCRKENPTWISTNETLNIAISEAKFQCCERNHVNNVECERNFASSILNTLHRAKVLHLYAENECTAARMFTCFREWWFRGLHQKRVEQIVEEEGEERVKNKEEEYQRILNSFKRDLRWVQDSGFFDSEGYSVLIYAVIRNDEKLVSHVLQIIPENCRVAYLTSRIQSDAYQNFGLFKGSTALSVAASFASSNIVAMLLDAGCDFRGPSMFKF